jgi:hypothetical protein
MNPKEPSLSPCADRPAVWHKDVGFLTDPRFVAAYRLGVASGAKARSLSADRHQARGLSRTGAERPWRAPPASPPR